jgi:DNA-binding response OmpR family regulator
VSKNAHKIMIADDDPAILDALEMLLVDEGYDVVTASDGDTLVKVRQHIPDLLLLDIWMSGEDGRDIAKILKAKELTKKIPIIMISASKDIDKSARDSGADDFLAKPFEISELLEVVEKYVNH